MWKTLGQATLWKTEINFNIQNSEALSRPDNSGNRHRSKSKTELRIIINRKFTHISNGNAGSLLPPHYHTEPRLVLHNAVGHAHLAAQGRHEQHNLKQDTAVYPYIYRLQSQSMASMIRVKKLEKSITFFQLKKFKHHIKYTVPS